MATTAKKTTTSSKTTKTTARAAATRKSTGSRKATTPAGDTKAAATATATAAVTDQGFRLSLGAVTLSNVDVKAAVTDSAYATVGATDKAVAVARELPQRVEGFVKTAPARVQSEVVEGIDTARKEFTSYATRGRQVVESVTKATQTKRAISQTEIARSQVKAAVTSVRKAVEQGSDAVEVAVERIGLRRTA